MSVSRRTALGIVAAAGAAATARPPSLHAQVPSLGDWSSVRALFELVPDKIHMSTMLITSHPAPVREAIGRHRDALDADPVAYLEENGTRLTEASRAAAASYLGMHPAHVALTDSTTMGVGLIYTGLKVGPGQEVLTTDEDYYVTHESLRHLTDATGATERRISLFDDISEATDGGIVQRIVDAIRPETRLLALTWVHSSTGLKIPVGSIAVALQEINAGRDEQDHVLFGLDAVHGFGVETDSFFDLGVDFLMAGCHKWLFGPRGTGIAAISERGLGAVRPIVPTFDDARVFSRWYAGEDYALSNNGRTLTPGGFKDFEHRWALAEAFALHEEIGRARVAERTHTLAGDLKDALAGIRGVSVVTPRQPGLSAGIVCFDVEGLEPEEVVSRLRSRSVVASVAPYPSAHVRLTPSIRNSEAEIEAAARAVRSII